MGLFNLRNLSLSRKVGRNDRKFDMSLDLLIATRASAIREKDFFDLQVKVKKKLIRIP